MLSDMKNYIRILIVVVIVVVGGFAIYKGTSRSPVNAPTLSSLPSGTPAALVTPVAIAYNPAPKDWLKYSSASMNFAVSYPKDWHVGACGLDCVGWAPPTLASTQFALGIIESSGSLDDLLKKAEPYLVKKEDVKVGNLDWIKLTLRQPQTGEAVTSHFIASGTKIYEFGTATSDPAIISVYGSMIASFKFLK
jgi:hypothetical protein